MEKTKKPIAGIVLFILAVFGLAFAATIIVPLIKAGLNDSATAAEQTGIAITTILLMPLALIGSILSSVFNIAGIVSTLKGVKQYKTVMYKVVLAITIVCLLANIALLVTYFVVN